MTNSKKTICALTLGATFFGSVLNAQDTIAITFAGDGSPASEGTDVGTLVLPGTAAIDFSASTLDETPAGNTGSFSITGLTGADLTITLEALSDDINFTENGLQDGGTGFNNSGEGIIFTFSQAVTIDLLEFGSFTSGLGDSATLTVGASITDSITGSNTTSGRYSPSSLALGSGTALTLSYVAGAFDLEQLVITTSAVPEPSTYAAILGALALGTVTIVRRRNKK